MSCRATNAGRRIWPKPGVADDAVPGLAALGHAVPSAERIHDLRARLIARGILFMRYLTEITGLGLLRMVAAELMLGLFGVALWGFGNG